MMQRASSGSPTYGWLKVFIGLGVIVVGYWVLFPLILQGAEEREWYRFQGCQKGQRVDCESSLVWQMENWSLEQPATQTGADENVVLPKEGEATAATNTTPQPTAVNADPSERRSTKTSDKAPSILSAALVDVTQQSGWFRPDVGAKVQVTATVSDAKTVEMYYNAKDVNGLPLVKKLGTLTSKSGGDYVGSFTVPANMLGEVEIRAMDGGKESASLFLPIAAN